MSSRDILVLGAGPAGVGAALWAARAGWSVSVLERAPSPGGAAGSFEVAGMRVDYGSHRLHPSVRPEVLAEIRDLLGGSLQERRRRGRIRIMDRWLGFPLRPVDALSSLPAAFLAGAALDAATSVFRRPREDSFAEIVRAGLGPTIGHHFYLPYARKIWGLDPDELSGEQARRRIGAATPFQVVRRTLRGRGGTFYYPAGGYGKITEALASAAVRAGATFHFDSEVVEVELAGHRPRVTLAGGDTFEGDLLWSTIPLTALARLTRPHPPAQLTGAARSLRFRAMVLAYAVLDGPRYTEFDAHYFPGSETPITRLSEPKNYRDDPSDPVDRTVLCAEIPCDLGDAVWRSDPGELGSLIRQSADRLGLPAIRPVDVKVRKLSHAYPVYRKGFETAFSLLDRWVDSWPQLLSFGRQGLFAHDNTHHALSMAWEAAGALRREGVFEREAWVRARRSFRMHVVED